MIPAATLLGLSLNFVGLNPIRALYWSAVLNGIVSAPLMVMLMVLTSNRKVVGEFKLPVSLKFVGWVATVVMVLASAAFLLSVTRGHF